MATLATESTACCTQATANNGYVCLHSLALLTGQIPPRVAPETISLDEVEQMLFALVARERSQEPSESQVESARCSTSESGLGHRYQLSKAEKKTEAAMEELVTICMLPESTIPARNDTRVSETSQDTNNTGHATASDLSTPALTPDRNTDESSSSSPAGPRNHHQGNSDTSSPSVSQGRIGSTLPCQQQGDTQKQVVPTPEKLQAGLPPTPYIAPGPGWYVDLQRILVSGQVESHLLTMYTPLVNCVFRIGELLRPYVNGNDMDEETVLWIHALADMVINSYKQTHDEMRARINTLAQAQKLLPDFSTAIGTEQLRTTVRIWKQELSRVRPYPNDEMRLFRVFCIFYDKTAYHIFLEAHRRSPLPAQLGLAPHLDAVYAIVEDVAMTVAKYQRELMKLYGQVDRAEERLKSHEAADRANAALEDLIKQVDERIRRQGEEE